MNAEEYWRRVDALGAKLDALQAQLDRAEWQSRPARKTEPSPADIQEFLASVDAQRSEYEKYLAAVKSGKIDPALLPAKFHWSESQK